MRRFTLQTLRDFGVGKSSIEDKIMAEISASSKVFLEKDGQPMMMAPLLQNVVGNIIYGIIFGHRYMYDGNQTLSNIVFNSEYFVCWNGVSFVIRRLLVGL